MVAARKPILHAVVAAALLGGAVPGPGAPGLPEAAAAVPAGAPVFTDPLRIDNGWFPFHTGGFKVYRGLEGRRRVTVVEQFLPETRTFDWKGLPVACRTLRDSKFEDGACTEISRSWYAQADDGSVWYFGEVSEPLPPLPGDDGDDEPGDAESGGWVVGLPGIDDPPGTSPAPDPFLYMPAAPEPGDSWKPEDLAGVVDETDRVARAGVDLRVPAGRFRGCLEIASTTAFDPGTETKWFAPGVGVVRQRRRGEELRLQASTLLRR
jgi:hypothetical protein